MLTVYSWPTPNGHKVHIMLEECGFRLGHYWQAVPVNIGTGEQFKPEFLAISPNKQAACRQQIHCLQPVQHCRHGYFSVAAQLAEPWH